MNALLDREILDNTATFSSEEIIFVSLLDQSDAREKKLLDRFLDKFSMDVILEISDVVPPEYDFTQHPLTS